MSKSQKDRSWAPKWFTAQNIDTVIVAFSDPYGRLLGKRMTREFFLSGEPDFGVHVCSYLMTADVEMNPLAGFSLASWDKGYGDFRVRVDPSQLRRLPWDKGTAIVLGDLLHEDGTPVAEAPRSMLARQIERLSELGLTAKIGSELEFVLFSENYHAIHSKGFRDLTPSSDYSIDYHILQPSRDEAVLRRIRNEMTAAGIIVECSKGETGKGQHEVNLLYAEAMEMADRHVIYKAGAKDIAQQEGSSLTFMAKWSESDAGSGLHLHTSLWSDDGRHNAFWDRQAHRTSELFGQFLGGLLKYSRELTYFFAPTVNSYKRYQPSSWAPTAIVCGNDNRSCGFRLVGHGDSLRIENRMGGADANPYLAFAATFAAGLRGIAEKLEPGEIFEGNAYDAPDLPRLPETLEEATELLRGSDMAREALGQEVVDYYVHAARLEAQAYHATVTDWERRRYFEQL